MKLMNIDKHASSGGAHCTRGGDILTKSAAELILQNSGQASKQFRPAMRADASSGRRRSFNA